MMKMVPVASSNLAAAGYDDTTGEMRVEFQNGGIYTYASVERAVYDGLLASPSPGKFFHANIKERYVTRRGG